MAEQKLSAAQRSKVRRLGAYVEPDVGEEGGELNIVPFLDMVVNIMMFVLATVAVTFTATIMTSPPSGGGGTTIRSAPNKLNLTMVLTNEGVALKGASGNVAPGCDGLGPGTTFPATGKDADGQPRYDVEGIRNCATKLKSANSEFKEELQIRVTASNNIAYRKVIECIDAVRDDKDGNPLFPEVLFGVFR